jgi:hypothetical protein
MKPPENLTTKIVEKSDEQLVLMLKQSDDWLPEALEIARGELQKRGIDTISIVSGPPPMLVGEPLFFPVSALKFVVMSTVTFGIYEVYWFYKNWKLIKQQKGWSISPFWRAFFGVFFCYSCFKQINETSLAHGLSFSPSPGLFATLWIIFTLTWRLPEPFWLVCFTAPFFLIPIQNCVNRLNAVVAPNHNTNSKFSGWNIAGIVAGGIFFLLAIVGTFMPKQ